MLVNPSSAFVGKPSVVASSSGRAKNARYARLFPSTRKSSASRAGPSSSCSSAPVSVFGIRRQRYRPPPDAGRRDSPIFRLRSAHPVTRVPMLSGSRLVVVTAEDDALVLRPPPPANAVADVGAAVRDALRFPLAGEPLEALVSRGTRATILVEPPKLPLPGTERDPRQAAIAAAVSELERLGVPTGYQTLLVAGGLSRRAGQTELETLVSPEFARRFHGHVEVHDVESENLVEVGTAGAAPLRINPALVDTDLVVVVTAAETVLHGGPAALVGAAGRE